MSAPAKSEEIEITPQMIDAGIAAIEPFDFERGCDGWLDKAEFVRRIYRAMNLIAPE